jgi:hypothetical protein
MADAGNMFGVYILGYTRLHIGSWGSIVFLHGSLTNLCVPSLLFAGILAMHLTALSSSSIRVA